MKKKIGLLSLALVLALGSLGVAYAAWYDDIDINQTVETGTVKIGIIKADVDLEQDKEVATATVEFIDEIGPWIPAVPSGAEPYAYDKAIVTIDNAFPCLMVDVEFYIGGMGTVPVHIIDLILSDPTNELSFQKFTPVEDPNKLGFFYVTGDPDQVPIINVWLINLLGSQLHQNQADKADLIFHVKQPAQQNHTYTFMLEVKAIQWNMDPNN